MCLYLTFQTLILTWLIKRIQILMQLLCDAVQTDETRRRSVHQWIQQTPGTAVSAEVPGVPDRKAGQVGDLPVRRTESWRHMMRLNLAVKGKCWVYIFNH